MMKQFLKKLVAALLCVSMLLPLMGAAESAEAVYGLCTGHQVAVRRQAGGNLWFRVDEGHAGQILGMVEKDGVTWYKISTGHPTPNGRSYIGYIMEEFFRPMTAAETEEYLRNNGVALPDETDPPADETDPPAEEEDPDHVEYEGVEVTGAKGKTLDTANFRTQPSTRTGSIIFEIPANTEVDVTAIPGANDEDGWYRARYLDKTGYIHSSLLKITREGTVVTPDADVGTDVTGAKGKVTADGVSMRVGPGPEEIVLFELKKDTEVEILTIPDQISVDDWYRVRYNGQIGYIQANFIRVTDEGSLKQPDAVAMGVTVNTNGVNFRTGPGKNYTSMGKLTSGIEVELLSIPPQVGTDYWYKVRYNGDIGYIQSPYIQVIGQDAPADPDEEVTPVVSTGVTTSTSGVNFRTGPGKNYSTMGKLPEGTVVELLSIPEVIDENHWYKVRYNNTNGYIQATFIRVLTINEDDLPDEKKYGYARLITDSVNLRESAGGKTVTTWKGVGSLMRIVGEPTPKGMYSWYPVYHTVRSTILYVRDDMIEVVYVENGEIVKPAVPPESAYGYIITIDSGVNLRMSPDSDYVYAQVPRNTVLACVADPVKPSGSEYTWYKVRYNGYTGYLRGDFVRVCTADGGELGGEDPDDPSNSTTIYGYIKLNTGNNVYLRKEPLSKEHLGLYPDGLILPVVGKMVPYGQHGNFTWYPVRTADGQFGYIRGDCVMECDKDGNPVEPETPEEPETPDLVGVTAKTVKNGNFRETPSTASKENIITVIPGDTVVTVLSIPEDTYYGWFKVVYNGETGYMMGYLLELQEEGSGGADTSAYGYIQVTGNRVYVRKTPGGTSLTQVDTYTVWPIVGPSKWKDDVEWFNIRVGDDVGFMHGGYCYKLSPEQEESYLKGEGVPPVTPPAEDVPSGYLITTSNKLYVRESYTQDSTAVTSVGPGTVLRWFETRDVGTVTWYCVLVDHVERWVHGNYIEEMTQAEYDEWAAANPGKVPDADDHLGYLKTNQDNVYIRNAAAGSEYITKILKKGTVMRYYSDAVAFGGNSWYRVLTPEDGYGYIRADLMTKCEEDGSDLPAPEPELGNTSSAPQSQQETTYSTLSIGSTGVKVANLVNELINQGYYKGEPTSTFTSDVQAAVKAFQRVNGLTVDGIAGSATQHKLFGTRPIGAGDTDNLDFTIYPVEKIDWFTGGIQEMLPRGANFKVYDVKTGIVWWAHRWAGGKHADIETLTKADSERLCKIYGVNDLQDIVDNNMWHRRPCLITIGTRTFAASLDGMQHNPDGDTIANNGMDGQICMHFTNSQGHSSGAVSESHAEAIEYAYNHCPAGKK